MKRPSEYEPPADILLVEDNPGDIRLIQEALKVSGRQHTLRICRDGEEASSYLQSLGDLEKPKYPNLILLDLNLPKVNGYEVLQIIKRDHVLKRIPTIVLSASREPSDINKAYAHHANCYLTKPMDFDDYIHIIQAIDVFWLTLAELPWD